MNAEVNETCAYLEDAAHAAEQLRKEGINVVFIASCEYTTFSRGFLSW